MREIKFRGLRVDGEGWVYGSLLHDTTLEKGDVSEYMIWTNEGLGTWHDIIPETVGQFTGLKDKNDVEIYEGDLMDCSDGIAKVIYANYSASFELLFEDDGNIGLFEESSLHIIGNIHENK